MQSQLVHGCRKCDAKAMRMHSLNKNFSWEQPSAPPRLLSAEQVIAYRDVGGFVLPDVFTATEIAALLEVLDPIEAASNQALADVPVDQPGIARQDEIVFQAHVVAHSTVARRFALHPALVALCNDLIGGAVRLYWDQLVYKYPDTQAEFPWHQDNGYSFVMPQQYLTCWVALTDATTENGCPWIAPGMHRGGTLHHRWTKLGFQCFDEPSGEAQPLPLRAGSIAVFSSLTPHRTGANLSNEVRKAYILQYAPDGAMVYPREGDAFAASDPERQFLLPQSAELQVQG